MRGSCSDTIAIPVHRQLVHITSAEGQVNTARLVIHRLSSAIVSG